MSTTLSLEVGAYLRLCEAVDTPRSLACFLLVSNDEWNQYLDLPTPFWDGNFKDNYLVTECLKKNADLPLNIDRKRVALDKFLESERTCKDTNDRITSIVEGNTPIPEWFRDVRYWLSRILGNLSKEKLNYAESKMRFGPGSTSSAVGAGVLPSLKYACDMHTTLRLRPLVNAFMGLTWFTTPHGGVFTVEHSKVTTVPKNAKTDRTICIEPHGNIFVQLGIGALIRRQLKRFGVDLDTQEWNQFLASRAGEWRLATIDLSMASDTVASNVVKYLFPKEWYQLLLLARCDSTKLPNGEVVQLEKFSSMGNGFTFELESLLFLAITLSTGAHKALVAVYGDDIIVEKKYSSVLIDRLNFLGFSTNRTKTFTEGNFFESCGTDWFFGQNVRPFYFKGAYNDFTESIFLVANAIRRYSKFDVSPSYRVSDARYLPAWLYVIHRADAKIRATGIPDGVGDEGLLRSFEEASPRSVHRGWNGYWGRVLPQRSVISRCSSQTGGYLLSLHHGSKDRGRIPESIRGSVERKRSVQDVHCWQWTGVGPWM